MPMCRISTWRSWTARATTRTTDASWKPLAVDHEIIHVRGGKDVKLDVQSTAHGPLLNPIFTKEIAAHRAEVDALRPHAEMRSRFTK